MSTQHTPGPWKWLYSHTDKAADLSGNGRDTRLIESFQESHIGSSVLWGGLGGLTRIVETEELSKADACLIAAAPDLLAALKAVLPTLDDATADANFKAGTGTLEMRGKWASAALAYKAEAAAARAAITKAEGKEQA